jgi:hypothetical protein
MVAFITTVQGSHPAYNPSVASKKVHTTLKENVLYEGLSQWPRTHKYYKTEVTRQFYTGS